MYAAMVLINPYLYKKRNFHLKNKLETKSEELSTQNPAHDTISFIRSRGEMMQGWDGSYEGCEPAQVAVVSNAPTHHVRTPAGQLITNRDCCLSRWTSP